MSNFQNFRHAKAKRNAALAGAGIMICITLLSCVSSFLIYREGFADMPKLFQNVLGLFAVVVVEGAFVFLIYGISKAFSSWLEKGFAVIGLLFVVATMLTNLVTHFQMAKGIPLHPWQEAWTNWGAVCVFIAVLLIVLGITLGDPIARLVRLDLRVWGEQQETILNAQKASLESERISTAMARRAEAEAEKLARQIEGESGYVIEDHSSLPLSAHGLNGHAPAYAHRSEDREEEVRPKARRLA
jgi:hypothetical protein